MAAGAGARQGSGSGARAISADGAKPDDAAAGGGGPDGPAQVAAASALTVAPDDSAAVATAAAAAQGANAAGSADAGADAAAAAGPGAAGAGVAGIGGVSGTAGISGAAATATALAASRAAAAVATQGAALLAANGDDDKHAHTADAAAPAAGGTDAVAGMFQLNPGTTTSAAADASGTPTFQLHANVDSSEFAQGLSDRVTYMVDNGLNGAKLQVNPPQLGPIELRIAVTGGHAQVWMTTHSAVTRDALESSSPKLREMLGAQGFGQVSVDISQRSFQDRSSQTQPYQRMAAAERGIAAPAAVAAGVVLAPRATPGALDAYA